MNVQFIGNTEQQILTTYHAPLNGGLHSGLNGGQSTGVLIATPIGTEYLRTHWALRRLTQQLTRAGFPVLRFDYSGVGDSSQDFSEVHSLVDWYDDLRKAAWSLQSQSECHRIIIVGLRLGAAIAIGAASDNQGVDGLSEIIGWQPVLDGKDYLQSQRSMHACMLDLWPTPINAIANRTHEEILGCLYSRRLLDEIESINLNRGVTDGLPKSVRYNDVSEFKSTHENNQTVGPSSNTTTRIDSNTITNAVENPAWDDLRYLEIAWLPLQEPRQILKLIQSSAKEAQ